MNDFNDGYFGAQGVDGFNAYLSKVFAWMFAGLALSFATAYATANSPTILRLLFSSTLSMIVLVVIELGLVITLSRNITRYSYEKTIVLFMLYSFVNGLTLSFIFIAYRIGTISTAFISAAALFGAMAFYGKMTKRDLSPLRSFFMMGLIGIILASFINFLFKSPAMDFAISGIGVFVFAGLTAYDMQKLRFYYNNSNGELSNNLAIMGALSLYLDFINIFLYLLRLFGRRD